MEVAEAGSVIAQQILASKHTRTSRPWINIALEVMAWEAVGEEVAEEKLLFRCARACSKHVPPWVVVLVQASPSWMCMPHPLAAVLLRKGEKEHEVEREDEGEWR